MQICADEVKILTWGSIQLLWKPSQTSCLGPHGNHSLSFPFLWSHGMVGGKLAFFPFSSIPSPRCTSTGTSTSTRSWDSPGYLTWFPLHIVVHGCRLASSFPLRQRLRHRHAHIIDKLCSVANTGLLHPFLLYHNAKLNMHPHGYIQASQLIDAHTPGTWFLVHDFGVIVMHP